MNMPQSHLSRRLMAATGIAASVFVGGGSPLLGAGLAGAEEVAVLAEAPERYTASVNDYTGTLTPAQIDEITAAVKDTESQLHLKLYVIYVNDFNDITPEVWTAQALRANGDANAAIYAVSIGTREFGVQTGDDWPAGTVDAMYDAAFDKLINDDWAGSAVAVAQAAVNPSATTTSTTTSKDGSGAAWLGAGAAGVAVAGGGVWAYSRRKTKKDTEEAVAAGREIAPGKTGELMELPLPALEQLAQEELVSTDESIRSAKEELDIAVAEFGAERTRSFTRAMNHSSTTLQKAFGLKQRLDSGKIRDANERRSMLVEIISSCGQADDALDAEAASFAQMRNLLVNASATLDRLTQSTVDLRTRMPQVAATLASLQTHYSEQMLASIVHNPQMANVSLEEAEKLISQGRALAAQPAGQQGGLVDIIRQAENAVTKADKLLAGVENAQGTISTAINGLPALIKEVEDEITEALQLREKGRAQNTASDWNTLDSAVAAARAALEAARTHGHSDPLGQWTALTDADSHLDDVLDTVREQTSDHARQLQVFDHQLSAAQSSIQAASDFISTRGRVIGSGARTKLAESQNLHAQALQQRNQDTRLATNYARQATGAAQQALRLAQNDVDDYQRRQRNNSSRSNTGAIITGMVLNEILSGGGFGGSGGFGGGGFGGGSHGGGGGGFRGGRF